MRTIVVGDAVIEAAGSDPAMREWLESFFMRSIVDAEGRKMLQLPPLEPPIPRVRSGCCDKFGYVAQ